MKSKSKFLIIAFSLLFIIIFSGCSNRNSYSIPLNKMTFYTVLDNNQTINVEFNDEDNPYEGKLYVPGNSNSIKLFWTNPGSEEMVINDYKTGEYQFSNKPFSFDLSINNEIFTLNIELVKTSTNIDPLFINIEEPLGLIDDMNNDEKHDSSCYGIASFNNETYYMSIKGRGNSTWNLGLKKPYNITFLEQDYKNKKSVSMIDGIETKKWSLLANYNDPTLLRNKIGYDLANEMSIGIDSKYYDVWMNGNFLGNYLVTPKNDYEAPKKGYILEIDNLKDDVDPQFHITDNGQEVGGLFFTVKSNESNISVDNIQNYVQKAWDAIEDYDSDEYLKYIDLDSWAKMYLLHEINKNFDVVCGSILMHRDGQSEDDKLIAGPIWDLDNALGTMSPNPDNGLDDETMFSGGYWYISSVKWVNGDYCFLQELGKHKDFVEKVKEVYRDYCDSIHDLTNRIEKHSKDGYGSAVADFIRWGNNRTLHDFYTDYDWDYDSEYPVKYQITSTYDDYVQNLLKYVNSRISFIDENINDIK